MSAASPTALFTKATLVGLLLATCLACDKNTSRLLPSEVSGTWTTEDPRYHGRLFELSNAFVIVVTGPEDLPSIQAVDEVKTEVQSSETTFTVYSTDHSQKTEYQMVFTFTQANGGEIRFRNQPAVWHRGGEIAE